MKTKLYDTALFVSFIGALLALAWVGQLILEAQMR